jgi:predicted nucleotidyltransferase component of viral defense system
MHDAIKSMLNAYDCQTRDDYENALREIIQEVALLGLWRAKFFEHAAFYGGTALRILYGLNRYSEDLDFSLLAPDPDFRLEAYGNSLQREIRSFGFQVSFDQPRRPHERQTAIDSAFLKTNTLRELLVIEADPDLLKGLHPNKALKVKLEIDTNPPPGFDTENRYLLRPIPFSIRVYTLPDLFAGKLHAVLCRKWRTRVKGRDWYDLAWYAGRRTPLHLSHLETRMRESGDYSDSSPLTPEGLTGMLHDAATSLDVIQARKEVERFLPDRRAVEIWSNDFFHHIADNIVIER